MNYTDIKDKINLAMIKKKPDSSFVSVKRLNEDGEFNLEWLRYRDDNPYRYLAFKGNCTYEILYSGFCQPPFIVRCRVGFGGKVKTWESPTLEGAATICDRLAAKHK